MYEVYKTFLGTKIDTDIRSQFHLVDAHQLLNNFAYQKNVITEKSKHKFCVNMIFNLYPFNIFGKITNYMINLNKNVKNSN